jgi:hypothetical protein
MKPRVTVRTFEKFIPGNKDNKVLIFPNSRGRAEEVVVKLKISGRVNGHSNIFTSFISGQRSKSTLNILQKEQ